jgi:protein-disulfide isomerase
MRLAKAALIALAAVFTLGATPAPRGGWTLQVTQTASGSHVMGNPAAAQKLTEFISYTCSHCAHFDAEANDPLRLYFVTPGKLSIEVQHLVRDPIDLTVAMLTNCGAPGRFFQNHTAFLRRQDTWLARAQSATPAQQARWSQGDGTTRRRAIAEDFGFYPIMQQRGYDRTSVDRCLADEAVARQLAEQTRAAIALGVEGTPSFALNGSLLAGTHDWQSLQTQLRARM